MKLEMFVDTQSLFYDVRRNFGVSTRLDFLKLPDNIAASCEFDRESIEKITAFIIGKGNNYQAFSNMLNSFGYEVTIMNKGSQDMEFAMAVTDSVSRSDGVILVTGNRKIDPVLNKLLGAGKSVYLISFPEFFAENPWWDKKENLQKFEILNDWMWNQD